MRKVVLLLMLYLQVCLCFKVEKKVETVDVYKQYFRLDGSTLLKSNNVLLKSINFPVENQHESLTFSFNYNELISGVVLKDSHYLLMMLH